MTDTENRVINIIADKFVVDTTDINMETSISNDLGADSLDTADLVITFETEFDIAIPDEDVMHLDTIQSIVDCINKNMVKE